MSEGGSLVFTRIFVPTDGTEASLRGLAIAARLAALYPAELIVATAVPIPDWVTRQNMEYGGVESYIENAAQRAFQEAAVVLRKAGVGAELKALAGPVPETLVAEIEKTGADLVIMGRRGRDDPKDYLLGSVSDRVARHVKVPILLVP